MTTELPPPDIRHTLTRPQIGALGGHGHMSSDKRHAGLTRTRTAFAVKPNLRFLRLPGGAVCVQVTEVEASWRMTLFQVDIAAEYNRASCAYAEIWRHENQHVAIARKHFMAADKALRQELGRVAAQTRPFVVRSTPQQAARDLSAHFLAQAEPVLDKYRRDSVRDNGAIDTPESYRAVGARCKDW